MLPTPLFSGFPGGSDGKESTCQRREHRFSPWVGRSPGEGNSNPLQYSCPEIPRTEEPGGTQSVGLQRVRQDLVTEHISVIMGFSMSIGV